jgi:TRAP-type mannitol/chloroaromatic compound transport system substrate-binding protein
MKRRDLLAGAATAAGAAVTFAAPSIAQGVRELKLATDWPKDYPGLGMGAVRLANKITTMTEGRLRVTVYPAGSLVKAFETYDAVSAGVADMYHSIDYYFEKKSASLNFFAAVPYGLTANEISAWINFGGGQALWDEVGAQFGIKPLMCGNTGVQMGGWFNKKITGPEAYKGLRYRMPGLGGEVLRRMGAIVVTTPGGEIVGALKSGAIDASEWVGPWLDLALGLDKAASYYYYPGFHEPGSGISLGINRKLWESLPAVDRQIIEVAAMSEVATMLAEFNAENAKWLQVLRGNNAVHLERFDNKLIKTFGRLSKEVLADAAAKDPLTRKVYDSYMAFLKTVMDWEDVAERGYLDTRRLALA